MRRIISSFLFCSLAYLSMAQMPSGLKEQGLINAISDLYIAPSADIGDPEKYYWPKAIARLTKYGDQDSAANKWIQQFSQNSPFHFTLVGMNRLWYQHSQAPALVRNKKRILEKVFGRTDSYNCWTAEGTENHINMSRTAGYLYAQAALEEGLFPEEASKRKAEMKQWLLQWSRLIYEKGTGEWNSGIYGLYNLIGWLNLFDFAKDPEVKAAARAVCDYYATELAMYYSWGVTGGAEMRGNGVGHNLGTSTSFLGWYWFGPETPLSIDWGKEYIQVVHAATSTYKPGPQIRALASKIWDKPASFSIQNPDYHITRLGFCQNLFYATSQFTLGSSASPYGGWTGSTSQMVNWKWVGKPSTPGDAPYQISGNGLYYKEFSGKIRDPFTQVVQHENVLIQMTRLPLKLDQMEADIHKRIKAWSKSWKEDFLVRFPSEKWKTVKIKPIKGKTKKAGSFLVLDQRGRVSLENGVYFVEYEGSYLAIRSISQNYPLPLKVEKRNRSQATDNLPQFEHIQDETEPGKLCGFVIEAGDFRSHGSFAAFRTAIKKTSLQKPGSPNGLDLTYTDSKGRKLKAEFQDSGMFEEAIVDWGYGVKSPQTNITSPPFLQPEWPSGYGHGRIARLSVDGNIAGAGKEVWKSSVLQLSNGILQLQINGQSFESHP